MEPDARREGATARIVFRGSLAVALLLAAAISWAGFGQGFDQPSTFGETGQAREFTAADPGEGSANDYFIHDQAIKIAIVGGLSLLALGLIALRGFRYRRWLLLLPIGLIGFYLGGILCPLSSVQNIFLKWHTAYLLLFAIPVVLALLAGRVFCGYVCPFGAVQELLHVRRWSLRIPAKVRRLLGILKYLILGYLVVRVVVTGTGILQGLKPFKALFEWGGTPSAIGLTVALAVLSVILWRPFCEVVCPLGALLSLVSRFSLFRLRAKEDCTSCGLCTSNCPTTACRDGEIRTADCYLCGECIGACPVGSLRLVPRWRPRSARKRDG